jgi:peptidoglycan/xylan/chitin deacetylase (PgdA/CDA1 family)
MKIFAHAFQHASPAGIDARLSVLIFHRVLREPDPLFPGEMHARRFDAVCGWLAAWFNVLPLDQAVTQLRNGTLPARAACITFDDGYADNHHVAMPILKRHGLTAAFFIATGFLDGGRMWNDTIVESIRRCALPILDLNSIGMGLYALDSINRRRAVIDSLLGHIKYLSVQERLKITEQVATLAETDLPRTLMMTSREVKAMRDAGMQIGAHTVSHPILANLSDEQARSEILSSKRFLEYLLNERIGLFAYPNGKLGEDYSARSVALVRSEDFDAALSTQWGTSGAGDDLFQIRRFTPWDRSKMRFGLRMLSNLRNT